MFAKRGRLINQSCIGLFWAACEEQKCQYKHKYIILRQRPLHISNQTLCTCILLQDRRSTFALKNGKSKYLQTIHKRFS